MISLTKLVFGFAGVGAAAFLGASLLQLPTPGSQSGALGASSDPAATLLQGASAQTDSMLRRAATEIPANLQSFSTSAGAIVRGNATTARLQLEGMAMQLGAMKNSLAPNSLRNWLPSGPNWIQNGVQVATQASSDKTRNLAQKMPVVNAVKSDLSRFADAHPMLSPASIGF